MREKESNISMRIEELEDKSGVEVAGRGLLHLSVLMETMRREGFEFQVGRPRVLIKKDESGRKLEPIEEATVDVPSEYAARPSRCSAAPAARCPTCTSAATRRTSCSRFRRAARWDCAPVC